ncbi:MAG: hypothetical protein IPL73_23140 [Candidatus Obscuribacter sp.]|nr:hypothetical protein [Candidatus Obscuribacter sp.]
MPVLASGLSMSDRSALLKGKEHTSSSGRAGCFLSGILRARPLLSTLAVVTISAGTLLLSGCAVMHRPASTYLINGNEYFKRGDYTKAEKNIEKL